MPGRIEKSEHAHLQIISSAARCELSGVSVGFLARMFELGGATFGGCYTLRVRTCWTQINSREVNHSCALYKVNKKSRCLTIFRAWPHGRVATVKTLGTCKELYQQLTKRIWI